MKKLGRSEYFLGIEVIHHDQGSIVFSQSKYIKYLLNHAHVSNANGAPTPMPNNLKLRKFGRGVFPDPHHYKPIVGTLQDVTLTRPDIAFSVNKDCQFMAYPLTMH